MSTAKDSITLVHHEGNEHFKSKEYHQSIECYSYCINNAVTKEDKHIYTLNRSKSYYFSSQYKNAMMDINSCINYFSNQQNQKRIDYYHKSLNCRANILFRTNKFKSCIKECNKIINTKHKTSSTTRKLIKAAEKLKTKAIGQQYIIKTKSNNKTHPKTMQILRQLLKKPPYHYDEQIFKKIGVPNHQYIHQMLHKNNKLLSPEEGQIMEYSSSGPVCKSSTDKLAAIGEYVRNTKLHKLVHLMHNGLKYFWSESDSGLCHPHYDTNKKPKFKLADIDDDKFKRANAEPFPSFMYPSDYFVKKFLVVAKVVMAESYAWSDWRHIHVELSGFDSHRNANEWLLNRRSNIKIQKQAKEYKLYLMNKFEEILINKYSNKKNINATYYLYIHLITHPQSPQIWRRMKVNGRMTLKQFDEAIRCCLGFQTGHNYEFRFNFDTFKDEDRMKLKTPPNRFIDHDFRLFNDEIDNHVDRIIYRLTKDGSITMDIGQLLMGQILSLYEINANNTRNKIPFDEFMYTHYKQYFDIYSLIMLNHKGFKYDKKMSFKNFNYNIPNTFQWIYDLGNDWRSNIYVEYVEYNDNNNDIKRNWCEYICGSGITPPDNLGDFEDFYLMCLKCLDKYKYDINEFKTKKDFYEWINGESEQMKRWKSVYLDKNEWNTQIYPQWVTNIKPYFKPYNINIDECFKWTVLESNIQCFMENKVYKLKILRRNIRNNRKCNNCKTRLKTLYKCKRCRRVRYCTKKCQKISWKYCHRFECHSS